jgi:hypothetical protein
MGRRSDRARIARLQRMAALPARIGLARSGDARALLGGNSPAQKAADARRMIILGRTQTNFVGCVDEFDPIFFCGVACCTSRVKKYACSVTIFPLRVDVAV